MAPKNKEHLPASKKNVMVALDPVPVHLPGCSYGMCSRGLSILCRVGIGSHWLEGRATIPLKIYYDNNGDLGEEYVAQLFASNRSLRE